MMSPVHILDIVDVIIAGLRDKTLLGKTIEIGGPEKLSWTEMIRCVTVATGRKKLIIPMPTGIMKLAALFLDWLPFFPVTRDQLTMLEEGNVADASELQKILGREPRFFNGETLQYLNQ